MQRQQYTCSMHFRIIENEPGRCAECGMNLIPVNPKSKRKTDRHQLADAPDSHVRAARTQSIEHHHHNGCQDGKIDDIKKRLYVALVLALPLMAFSPEIQHWLQVDWSFPHSKYILLILSSILFFYGGWPFFTGLQEEVKSQSPGKMTLVAVAITIAYVYSVAIVFGLEGVDFFWELAILILITLLGYWIETRSIKSSSRELSFLIQLMPSDAHLVHGDHVIDVKATTLKRGDLILIKPGEKVAADGTITEGLSNVNESMMTGESKPIEKRPGDQVIGGSINGEGELKVEVAHETNDSYLSQVVKLAQETQKSKSRVQILAENSAKWLTIIALASALFTLAVWLALGKDLAFAIERMITVIIICSPYALGLAVPLVVAYSTSVSAGKGLLIKNRMAFDSARKISTIAFHKTGTLTRGEFRVSRYDSFISTYTNDEILTMAASLESNSDHPIAKGIIQKARELNLQVSESTEFKALPGRGIQAVVDRKKISVVSPEFLKENNLHTDFTTSAAETTVFIVVERRVAGFVSLVDEIRPESREAIGVLRKAGIKTLLLTGDNKGLAQHVCEVLGMNGFVGELSPHQKLGKIRELRGKGEFVAMTGDGTNDAQALTEAGMGIAIGSGSDIAAKTADIVLANSNPRDVVNLVLSGKTAFKRMVQNLVWAIAYNIIALPLAAGVLYHEGIILSPAAGAVLMTMSTGVVLANSQLLRRRQ